MSDETRPDEGTPDPIEPLPALDDGDADPDSLAGDLTDPDIDLSHLQVEDDEDGGDEDE